jgi:sugar/nucleoside kinase (ribokinase family)
MKTDELIAIGGVYLDINAPQFPLEEGGLSLDTKVIGDQYIVEPGGSAANFARICSSMSIPTTFVGKVGKDAFGEILTRRLIDASVRPSLIESDEVSTNISFNMINPDGRSIMEVVGSANQSLTHDEVCIKASKDIASSSYLYIGGCFELKKLMPSLLQIAQEAKKVNTKVILDHGRLNRAVTDANKKIMRSLAIASDIYLPSADEFTQLWDSTSIEEGMLSFSKQSEAILVVKNSSKGALTFIDGEIMNIPPLPVVPIHTVGAGDSFDAGFIAAQRKGLNVLESVIFACATAALKISRPDLPMYSEVLDLVEQRN